MCAAVGSTTESDPAEEHSYDAFVSYSHAADGLLAPRLQSGLQRFAKPWWKRRAVRVFRDETSLSASPHLWSSITTAIDESAWFVLLLSPEAADSRWVNQEIEYWVLHKASNRILPVLTDGTFEWRDGDIAGSSVPEKLQGVFTEEPRLVDLRFARGDVQLDLQDPRFSDAVADIACTLRGVPKDELQSEEVRQHRRTMRTAWASGIALALAVVASVVGWTFALDQRNDARRERDLLAFSQLVNRSLDEADEDLELALLLAVESYRRNPGPESSRALLNALTLLPSGLTVYTDSGEPNTTDTEVCSSAGPDPGIFVNVAGAAENREVVVFDAAAGETDLRLSVPFDCGARLLPDGRLVGFDSDREPPAFVVLDDEGDVIELPTQVRRVFGQHDDGSLLAGWNDSGGVLEQDRLVLLDGDTGALFEETGVATVELLVDPTGRRAVIQSFAEGEEGSAGLSKRAILDLETFAETALESSPEAIYAWDPDGSSVLAFVGEELMRFDLSGRLVEELQLETKSGAPTDLSFSPTGNAVALVTLAGLEVFAYPDLEPVVEPVPVDYQLAEMSMIDDDRLATQDRTGVVRVISLSGSGALENRVVFGRFNDTLLMLSPDYGLVWPGDDYEGYTRGVLLPVDLSTGRIFDPFAEFDVPVTDWVVPMIDGRWVVLSDSGVKVVDDEGTEFLQIEHLAEQIGLANTFAGGRWGRLLDGIGSDPTDVNEVQITSIDVLNGRVTVESIAISNWLERPEASEGGFWVQTSPADDVEIYDWSGRVLGVAPGPIDFGSALSPDASSLAVVQSDRSVRVYNVRSGEAVADLGADSHFEDPLFLDAERIVVRSTDGNVVLWDISVADPLGTVAEAPSWAPSLEWGTSGYEPTLSRDGTSFWFTQPGQFVEIMVQPSDWVEAACAAAGRPISQTEWEHLIPYDEPYSDPCAID